MASSTELLRHLIYMDKKSNHGLTKYEADARRFFKERGISPTLAEYSQLVSAFMNGQKPLGIH